MIIITEFATGTKVSIVEIKGTPYSSKLLCYTVWKFYNSCYYKRK